MKINLNVEVFDDSGVKCNDPDTIISPAVMAVVDHCEAMINLVWRKNQDYGNAWASQGWMGNLARMQSKMSRLKNMLWNDKEQSDHVGESVVDTAQDLAALSTFFVVNYTDGNRWGPQ